MKPQRDKASLADNLRAIEEMARECHAFISYLGDWADRTTEQQRSRLHSVAFMARDGIACIADLRRDLDALLEIESAGHRYVRALEQLSARYDAQRRLEPVVVAASGAALAVETATQGLHHQVP